MRRPAHAPIGRTSGWPEPRACNVTYQGQSCAATSWAALTATGPDLSCHDTLYQVVVSDGPRATRTAGGADSTNSTPQNVWVGTSSVGRTQRPVRASLRARSMSPACLTVGRIERRASSLGADVELPSALMLVSDSGCVQRGWLVWTSSFAAGAGTHRSDEHS